MLLEAEYEALEALQRLWNSDIEDFTDLDTYPKLESLKCKPTNNIRLLTDLGGHAISMAVFGYAGYWAYRWDERAAVLLAEKRAELAARRRPQEIAEES